MEEDKDIAGAGSYKALMDIAAQKDSMPKNLPLVPEADLSFSFPPSEYPKFCFDLAQGCELDWVDHSNIVVNEFGEPEHWDSFMKRHPNFYQDVEEMRERLHKWRSGQGFTVHHWYKKR